MTAAGWATTNGRRGTMRVKLYLMVIAMTCTASQLLAGSASTYMSVSVQVVPNCQIAVTDLAFGAYDPLLANAERALNATADVRMLCTKNSQANIVLDYGRNSRGPARGMAAGADRVSYELYQDASRNTPWGGSENSLHIIGVGGRGPQRYVVYGRVPPGQEGPPGAYTDVIMATVDF